MSDPTDVLERGAEVYESKNEDYADSWKLVGEILYELSGNGGVVLESKEDFISFGLYTRRLDKIARAFNGEFNSDDMNFESVIDSHRDECVYGAMAASLRGDE